MYTETERKDILDKLIVTCKAIHEIDALILVGSGAEGFTDRWSDIDLSVVTCKQEKTRQIWKNINEKIASDFEIIKISYNEYGDNNFLSAMLLSNYLEIDIGVISVDKLLAKRSGWSIVYDNSGAATEKMKRTWQERKIPDINIHIEKSLNSIWYHITHISLIASQFSINYFLSF